MQIEIIKNTVVSCFGQDGETGRWDSDPVAVEKGTYNFEEIEVNRNGDLVGFCGAIALGDAITVKQGDWEAASDTQS